MSVSERAVAETCLVTESPKKLKSEMEHMIASEVHSTILFESIWFHPRETSNQPA